MEVPTVEVTADPLSVTDALKQYVDLLEVRCKVNDNMSRAEDALERAVLATFDPPDNGPPCSETDPIEVLCGSTLIRLRAVDRRPSVEIESLVVVE